MDEARRVREKEKKTERDLEDVTVQSSEDSDSE